jgi:hypothetical protein
MFLWCGAVKWLFGWSRPSLEGASKPPYRSYPKLKVPRVQVNPKGSTFPIGEARSRGEEGPPTNDPSCQPN